MYQLQAAPVLGETVITYAVTPTSRHATSKQPDLILITFLATETETTTATAYYPGRTGGITKPLEMPRPKLTSVKKETKGEGSSERRRQTQVFFLFFRK